MGTAKLEQLGKLTKEYCAVLWKGAIAGVELDQEASLILKAMQRHAEWSHLWEAGPDFSGDIVTKGGVSPYATIALEAAVDGMVGKDGDKFARRTFEQLQREGLPESNARAEIGRCFTAVLWELGHGKTDPEQATKRFRAILRRVQDGETTVSIWPDEEA